MAYFPAYGATRALRRTAMKLQDNADAMLDRLRARIPA